jgi:nitrate reductase delta subunit
VSPLLSRRRAPSGLQESDVRATWQVASLLLDHPEPDDPLDVVADVLPALPGVVAEPLGRFLEHRRTTPLRELQAEYVDTFDTRRRCSPYLTYFLHGDTRKRGMALLRFKQAYREAGLDLDDRELPDHLCVVLEFGATGDAATARRLLTDHRAGLEVLRLSLEGIDSAYADVVAAVCATLPPIDGEGLEAVRRLAEQGPPDEEVGMTPYGTPGFDPALAAPTSGRAPGPVDLGLPSYRPAPGPAATSAAAPETGA